MTPTEPAYCSACHRELFRAGNMAAGHFAIKIDRCQSCLREAVVSDCNCLEQQTALAS